MLVYGRHVERGSDTALPYIFIPNVIKWAKYTNVNMKAMKAQF